MHKQWDEEIFWVPVKIRIQAYLLRLRSQPRRTHSPSHTQGSYVIIKKVMVLCLYYCVYELLGNYFTRITQWSGLSGNSVSSVRVGSYMPEGRNGRNHRHQRAQQLRIARQTARPSQLCQLSRNDNDTILFHSSFPVSRKDIRPFLLQDKLEVEQVFVWAIVQNVG